jgi:hypothetical protein
MKKPEQERKPEETKMMDAWKKWMTANASKVADKGAGAGKPKVVSSSGVKDARNDIMVYQIGELRRSMIKPLAFRLNGH